MCSSFEMGGDGGVIAVKRKFIKECKTEDKVIGVINSMLIDRSMIQEIKGNLWSQEQQLAQLAVKN